MAWYRYFWNVTVFFGKLCFFKFICIIRTGPLLLVKIVCIIFQFLRYLPVYFTRPLYRYDGVSTENLSILSLALITWDPSFSFSLGLNRSFSIVLDTAKTQNAVSPAVLVMAVTEKCGFSRSVSGCLYFTLQYCLLKHFQCTKIAKQQHCNADNSQTAQDNSVPLTPIYVPILTKKVRKISHWNAELLLGKMQNHQRIRLILCSTCIK